MVDLLLFPNTKNESYQFKTKQHSVLGMVLRDFMFDNLILKTVL